MYPNGEGEKFGEGVEYSFGAYRFRGCYVGGKRSGYGTLIIQNS